jgi:hypothetical protein
MGPFALILLALFTLIGFIVWIAINAWQQRQRVKLLTDFNTRLLDRLGLVKDFSEFVQTGSGGDFMKSLASDTALNKALSCDVSTNGDGRACRRSKCSVADSAGTPSSSASGALSSLIPFRRGEPHGNRTVHSRSSDTTAEPACSGVNASRHRWHRRQRRSF